MTEELGYLECENCGKRLPFTTSETKSFNIDHIVKRETPKENQENTYKVEQWCSTRCFIESESEKQ